MATYYSHEDLNYSIKPANSQSVHLSELDLFSSVATQEQIESTCHERIHCIEGSLEESNPQVKGREVGRLERFEKLDEW